MRDTSSPSNLLQMPFWNLFFLETENLQTSEDHRYMYHRYMCSLSMDTIQSRSIRYRFTLSDHLLEALIFTTSDNQEPVNAWHYCNPWPLTTPQHRTRHTRQCTLTIKRQSNCWSNAWPGQLVSMSVSEGSDVCCAPCQWEIWATITVSEMKPLKIKQRKRQVLPNVSCAIPTKKGKTEKKKRIKKVLKEFKLTLENLMLFLCCRQSVWGSLQMVNAGVLVWIAH